MVLKRRSGGAVLSVRLTKYKQDEESEKKKKQSVWLGEI